MAKKSWTFKLQGRTHVVDLELGYFSGKRVISLDGQVLAQWKKVFDTGSRRTFPVDGYEATLTIYDKGLTYGYSLDVEGTPVRGEGEEVPVGGPPTPVGTMPGPASDSVAAGSAPTSAGDVAAAGGLSPVTVATAAYALMLREIRSWGFWSLGLGALHLVGWDLLNAPWGVLLALVGLGSFLFHDAAMFVVYGTTIACAAFMNLFGGSAIWIAFAAGQAVLAVRVFAQFFRFRQAERDFRTLAPATAAKDPASGRAARIFPALGCLLGLFSLGGAQATFVTMVLMGEAAPLGVLSLVVEGMLNLAVLGLAVCLASLLAGYRYKILAGFGAAGSTLVLMGGLALAILG